ncbi:MAG: ubiquinol-cytochrome C chaperone family protein [Pseudomonadota bacterium]|uniref:ubiquinol-cytochrome C chaperone family protein n=1 Tax=Sphingomonas sp. ERG5 TaxID=1381597 RepID=UPI00054B6FE8|nr:ubiquinol-cytochrome C chaperone family protein [Sphingomonas sp. ERG5]
MAKMFGGIFGGRSESALPLYNAVVTRARAPHWYLDGQVPDTVDGRFDMVAAILSFVVLRLEKDPAGAATSALLTEHFVSDMDGQLRELGIGDVVVGKHIGKMMSMLGGRIGAYRDGLAAGDLPPALLRNLYRGVDPGAPAVGHARDSLVAFDAALTALPLDAVMTGQLP